MYLNTKRPKCLKDEILPLKKPRVGNTKTVPSISSYPPHPCHVQKKTQKTLFSFNLRQPTSNNWRFCSALNGLRLNVPLPNKKLHHSYRELAYAIIVVNSSDCDNGGTNRRLVAHVAVEEVGVGEEWSCVTCHTDDHRSCGCPRGSAAVTGRYIQLQGNIFLC